MLAVGSLALGGCPGTLPDDFPGLHPGGSGGAGGGGAGTGGAGAACDAPTKVFTGSCALSACHDGTFIPNLKTNPLASLRDVTAATSKVPCLGLPLLNPDMPAASVILTRISGGTCGDQMPDKLFNPNVVYLDQAGIDCVTSWVIANAKP